MTSLELFTPSLTVEYCAQVHLNLYDSPACQELATQVAAGRHLRILSLSPVEQAMFVCSCEDNYSAWLPLSQVSKLTQTPTRYQAALVSRAEIEFKLPQVVAFAQAAMKEPNYYLWGGTVAPNYDCSGLVQAAFASVGIWLPRDSYQQAEFTQAIPKEELQLGDLIFFATTDKVNHVALCLGDGYYIHSSGKEIGRNGIGIDLLSEAAEGVGQAYYPQFWGAGRVMSGFSLD